MPVTLGLIAGSGRLPFEVAEAARESGIDLAVLAIENNTDPAIESLVVEVGLAESIAADFHPVGRNANKNEPSFEARGMTDPSGHWRIESLPPGEYRVMVVARDATLLKIETFSWNATSGPKVIELQQKRHRER